MQNIKARFLLTAFFTFCLLCSTSLALAEYTYLGDFYSNWAEYEGNGQGSQASWTADINEVEYKLNGQGPLIVDGHEYKLSKDDNPDQEAGVLHNEIDYDYIILKGGSDNRANNNCKGKGASESNGYAKLWSYAESGGKEKKRLICWMRLKMGDLQSPMSQAITKRLFPERFGCWAPACC